MTGVDEAEHQHLAECVLTMALSGSMPDTYWATDLRILAACRVLGIQPGAAARQHAERITR